MCRFLAVVLMILALASCLLPEFYDLGDVEDKHLYFYQGTFILSTNECFLENGEVIYYKSPWGTTSFMSISVVLLAGIASAVLWGIGSITAGIRKAFRK